MGKKCNRLLRSLGSSQWSLRKRSQRSFSPCGTSSVSKRTDGQQRLIRDTNGPFRKFCSHSYEKGELTKAKYSGYYSVRQEQFLTDKERNEAGEFGPEWGEVILLEEENWYFPLVKHKEWLKNFVETHPDFVIPNLRRNELLNAIERLSGDLCVSRPKERLSWGIEFPFDPNYVTFVWFDALLNYVSFAGYLSDNDPSLPDFDELWPCKAHIIGKDILVPAHGVYWPIMLHAMGFSDEQMPRLVVHGWWNVAGAKMSKSLGNTIDPDILADKYGADALRYYLMRDNIVGQDSDFSEENLVKRNNSDLANDLGNLVNRTISMSQRYRNGRVESGELNDPDLNAIRDLVEFRHRTLPCRFRAIRSAQRDRSCVGACRQSERVGGTKGAVETGEGAGTIRVVGRGALHTR